MGLTWDTAFLRTVPGMAMSAEVVLGGVGGVIGIILASGFESFIFWTTVIISGIFLFTHVTNLTQTAEAMFPFFAKMHLGYLGIWTGMLLIDFIICILTFKLIGVVVFLLLISFLVDLFMKYRKWKSGTTTTTDTAAPTSPASVESGGKF